MSISLKLHWASCKRCLVNKPVASTVGALNKLYILHAAHMCQKTQIAVMYLVRVWIHGVRGLADQTTHFKMRITLGMVLVVLLVFTVIIRGSLRSGSGLHPNLWVQKKIFQFRQSVYNPTLCPAKLMRQFFSYSLFYLLRNLGNVILIYFRNIWISR